MARLWLAWKLREEAEKSGGVLQLSRKIRQASGCAGIERRRLALLIDDAPNWSIKKRELYAIEAYLAKIGCSLTKQPLLEHSGLLTAFSNYDAVKCYVACADGGAEEVARCSAGIWDFKCFTQLERQLGTISNAPLTLRETKRMSMAALASASHDVRTETAREIVAEEQCICSIGALFVSDLSEYMLAHMVGVRPFEAPTAASTSPVPLQFVCYHPPTESSDFRPASRFAITADDLRHGELQIAEGTTKLSMQELVELISARQARAVVFDQNVYPILFEESQYFEYGVIAAQLRPSGSLWTVVAGMSGPGTLAAAKLLSEVTVQLETSSGSNLKTIFAVVKAPVELKSENGSPEDRILGESSFVKEPVVLTGQPLTTSLRNAA